ncbi:Metallophosphoesterase domain protein, partial [Metarhizium hybridum]
MGLLVWLGLRRSNQWEGLTVLDHLIDSPLTFFTINFYHLVLFLRGTPFRPPRHQPSIRVVCISDTHDQVVDVPPGDILVHAGDLTNAGTAADIQKQLDWLKTLPHPVKIVIAGNHDSYFDIRSRCDDDRRRGARLNLDGLIYLQGEISVHKIRGREISIFGAPDIPECGPKSFALHVFGHCHCAYGKESVYFDDVQFAYERLLSRPRRGFFWDLIPNQSWVDMFEIIYHGIHSVLWKWLMSGPGSNQGSLMVNAAQMYKNSGKAVSRAVVVDI